MQYVNLVEHQILVTPLYNDVRLDGVKNIGWHVGYLERDNNIYFYALNFENQDPNFDLITIRKKILYDIFQDIQLLQ